MDTLTMLSILLNIKDLCNKNGMAEAILAILAIVEPAQQKLQLQLCSFFDFIPNEIIYHLFAYVNDLSDIQLLMLTCKRFLSIFMSSYGEYLFHQIALRVIIQQCYFKLATLTMELSPALDYISTLPLVRTVVKGILPQMHSESSPNSVARLSLKSHLNICICQMVSRITLTCNVETVLPKGQRYGTYSGPYLFTYALNKSMLFIGGVQNGKQNILDKDGLLIDCNTISFGSLSSHQFTLHKKGNKSCMPLHLRRNLFRNLLFGPINKWLHKFLSIGTQNHGD